MNENLKKILVMLFIAFVVVLTLMYVKRLPPVMKIAALAVDTVVIYYAYTLIKPKQKTKKEDEFKN